jgi:hypothetical protein
MSAEDQAPERTDAEAASKAQDGGAAEGKPPAKDESAEKPDAKKSGGKVIRLRLPVPFNPIIAGAVLLALASSAVSVSVVLKAAGMRPEVERLRQAAIDPAGLSHYSWANARLLAGETYRPGELTIVYGGTTGAAWEMLTALQRDGVHNRCLPGQNTTQLILRMEQDVLALRPRAMIFLPPVEDVQNASRTLLHTRLIGSLAEAHGIRPALATIPPIAAAADTVAGGYLGGLRAVNQGLADLAREMDWPLLDLYSALAGDDFYLAPEFTGADPWPNIKGYVQATGLLAGLLHRWDLGAPAAPELDDDFGLAGTDHEAAGTAF